MSIPNYITSFFKISINWIHKKLESWKERKTLFQMLYDEICRIYSKLEDIRSNLENLKPSSALTIKIPFDENDYIIYNNNLSKLGDIAGESRNKIIVCYSNIDKFSKGCKEHNELLDNLFKTFIDNGVSTKNMDKYDPMKMTAFVQVNKQYILLQEHTESMKLMCKTTLLLVENTINELKNNY
jgi:hypothetical protein